MAIYAYEKDKEREYEQPKTGTVKGYVGGVWDVGFQPGYKGKPPQHSIILGVEIEQVQTNGKRFVLFPKFGLWMGEKANLRKFADLMFPDESKAKFDVERFRGCNVLATIAKGESGKAYVASMVPLPEEMKPITPQVDFSKPFGLAKWAMEHQVPAKSEPEEAGAGHDPEAPPAEPYNPISDPDDFVDPATGRTRF